MNARVGLLLISLTWAMAAYALAQDLCPTGQIPVCATPVVAPAPAPTPTPEPTPTPIPAPTPTAALCERLVAKYGTDVAFCEDFENPGYPQNPGDKITPAWAARWGSVTSKGNCMGPVDVCPGGSGYAIWTLTKADQCGGAMGESGTSCVFDGLRSYASVHKPLSGSGGLTGEARWPALKDFGITYALRMSPTFRPPDDSSSTCGDETTRTGYKLDRFLAGGVKNTFFGHGNWSTGAVTSAPGAVGGASRNFPFRGGVVMPSCGLPPSQRCDAAPVVRKGIVAQNDTGTFFGPSEADYLWGKTEGPGQWICYQVQVSGWGTSSTVYQAWVNGRSLVDATTNTSRVTGLAGVEGMILENYVNGCYNGPNTAARFEDNIVVMKGSRVSCAEIGFKTLP